MPMGQGVMVNVGRTVNWNSPLWSDCVTWAFLQHGAWVLRGRRGVSRSHTYSLVTFKTDSREVQTPAPPAVTGSDKILPEHKGVDNLPHCLNGIEVTRTMLIQFFQRSV
jgi:hypothetical protein